MKTELSDLNSTDTLQDRFIKDGNSLIEKRAKDSFVGDMVLSFLLCALKS